MDQSAFQRGEFSMDTPVLCVLGKCSEFSLVFVEIVEVGQKGEEREQGKGSQSSQIRTEGIRLEEGMDP